MCTQRRQRNEGYTASDFYYSAIVVLVERGLLHGHITRSYKRTKDSNEQATRNLAWAEHGKQLAARVRFCPQNASAAQLQQLRDLLVSTRPYWVEEADLGLPDGVCTGTCSTALFCPRMSTFAIWLMYCVTLHHCGPRWCVFLTLCVPACTNSCMCVYVVVENPTASLERQHYMQVHERQ